MYRGTPEAIVRESGGVDYQVFHELSETDRAGGSPIGYVYGLHLGRESDISLNVEVTMLLGSVVVGVNTLGLDPSSEIASRLRDSLDENGRSDALATLVDLGYLDEAQRVRIEASVAE